MDFALANNLVCVLRYLAAFTVASLFYVFRESYLLCLSDHEIIAAAYFMTLRYPSAKYQCSPYVNAGDNVSPQEYFLHLFHT